MHRLIDLGNPRSLAEKVFSGNSAHSPDFAHLHMASRDTRSRHALHIQERREYEDV